MKIVKNKIMSENDMLKFIVWTVLHILNWVVTASILIGFGMLSEYVIDHYTMNPLVALPFTIMVLSLLVIPFNYFENKIDNICG